MWIFFFHDLIIFIKIWSGMFCHLKGHSWAIFYISLPATEHTDEPHPPTEWHGSLFTMKTHPRLFWLDPTSVILLCANTRGSSRKTALISNFILILHCQFKLVLCYFNKIATFHLILFPRSCFFVVQSKELNQTDVIVPCECAIPSCLSNTCLKLQCPVVFGNYGSI